jgi:hypothetical protein
MTNYQLDDEMQKLYDSLDANTIIPVTKIYEIGNCNLDHYVKLFTNNIFLKAYICLSKNKNNNINWLKKKILN